MLVRWSYISNVARFVGVHAWKRASGIIAESMSILGREIYGIFALYQINHSVRIWARYATTHGKRASCNSTATVPEVHNATVLAWAHSINLSYKLQDKFHQEYKDISVQCRAVQKLVDETRKLYFHYLQCIQQEPKFSLQL